MRYFMLIPGMRGLPDYERQDSLYLHSLDFRMRGNLLQIYKILTSLDRVDTGIISPVV